MKKLLLLAAFLMVPSVSALAEEPWQFIIVGDSRSSSHSDGNGVNIAILTEIADEIAAHNVDFVLFPGDLVNGGIDQATLEIQLLTWRDIMQPVYDAGIDVYPVRGNHELGNPSGTTAWNNVFSGDYLLPQNGPATEMNLTYSVTHKNVFILALDQYVNTTRVNQPWVDTQLAANTAPHIVAFGHVPAFKVHHTNCLDDYPADRDTFWQSLIDAGCDIYACGHDHFYNHAVIDNNDADPANDIHQYVVGTAGAPLYDWSPPYDGDNSEYILTQHHHHKQFGYLLADVTDEKMKITWYERNDATGEYEAGSAEDTISQQVAVRRRAIENYYEDQLLQLSLRTDEQMGQLEVDELAFNDSCYTQTRVTERLLGIHGDRFAKTPWLKPTRRIKFAVNELPSRDIEKVSKRLVNAHKLLAQAKSDILSKYETEALKLNRQKQRALTIGLDEYKKQFSKKPKANQKKDAPENVVTGILFSDDNPTALLNGKIVHIGDELDDDITITDITKGDVEFEKNCDYWKQTVGEKPSKYW